MENFENKVDNNYDKLANSLSFDSTEKLLNDKWWFSEVTDYKGKKVFGYTAENWEKWEIVTEKSNDTEYKIRVKKWVQLPNWKDWWQTQKNWTEDLFSVTVKDSLVFNKKLRWVLNHAIWSKNIWFWKLIPFSTVWNTVFGWLNTAEQTNWNNESIKFQKQANWNNENLESQKKTNLKKKQIDLEYEEINKEVNIDANYPKNEKSVEWRITRCLRFSSITDAVEDRYWIPRWLLMAMMAQEWWWDPTVINQRKSKDENKTCDWWAWLVHIQAANAAEYWLTTLPRTTNGMIDYAHWEKLEKAKNDNKNDLAKLSELDDRFNPVLSVDVTARYLMEYCGWKNKRTWDEWMLSVCKYAWRWMQDYWYSVIVYWTTINSVRGNPMPTFSNEIEKVKTWEWSAKVNGTRENVEKCISRSKTAINNLQPKFDWKEISLNDYYTYLRWQRDNYWLQKYKDYNKEHPYKK